MVGLRVPKSLDGKREEWGGEAQMWRNEPRAEARQNIDFNGESEGIGRMEKKRAGVVPSGILLRNGRSYHNCVVESRLHTE